MTWSSSQAAPLESSPDVTPAHLELRPPVDPQSRLVDAAVAASEAVGAVRAQYADAGVRLDVAGGASVVRVDPRRLGEVLANLLDNALRRTLAGGTVRVAVGADPSGAVLEVTDTGEGFDPPSAQRIFDSSYQADPSQTPTSAGSEAVLTIARAFVVAHGGTITATSDGHTTGATLRVRLPGVSAS